MSQNTLSLILKRIDAPITAVFSHDEIILWPEGDLELLLELGLLRESSPAKSVECDECEEACIEEVIYIDGPKEGQVRAYVACHRREDVGRIQVQFDRLRRWEVNLPLIARGLAELVGFTYEIDEVIDGRLWYLGAPYVEGNRIDLFFARGIKWPDGRAVFANVGRIQECSEPIILVPYSIPTAHPFTHANRILSLSRLLYIEGDQLEIRMDELGAIAGKARGKRTRVIPQFKVPPDTRWGDLTFTFPNDEVVQVSGPSINEPRSFVEMGFQNKHMRDPDKACPDKLWRVLLLFAKLGGYVTWADLNNHIDLKQEPSKKNISDLRLRLKSLFATIEDDKPISNYSRETGYRCKIHLVYSGENPIHGL